jgi:inosine-uridine nucleoside N-ribohydrolase
MSVAVVASVVAALVLGALLSAAAAPQVPVWIDADTAVGVPDRDVDDGVALLQAFHSPELRIEGVSIVFGNTDLERAWPIGQSIVHRFGPEALAVHRGAAGAADLGVETDASRALARALERGRLTVVALGPATNVATVLKNHPALASRIDRIVAVAGRRPGQRFTTGTTNTNGHRDFNFEEDPDAFRVLLSSAVPITLAPFEISSKVWITAADLDTMSRGSAGARWLAPAAREWLALWTRTFAVDGFNPFDTLAVARVTSPALLSCAPLPARIDILADDATEKRMQGTMAKEKPYLVVDASLPPPRRVVEYCHGVSSSFKSDLLARLNASRSARAIVSATGSPTQSK